MIKLLVALHWLSSISSLPATCSPVNFQYNSKMNTHVVVSAVKMEGMEGIIVLLPGNSKALERSSWGKSGLEEAINPVNGELITLMESRQGGRRDSQSLSTERMGHWDLCFFVHFRESLLKLNYSITTDLIWLNELLFKVQIAPLFYMEYKINSINIYRNFFAWIKLVSSTTGCLLLKLKKLSSIIWGGKNLVI